MGHLLFFYSFTILCNEFEYYTCIIAATSPRDQWVNTGSATRFLKISAIFHDIIRSRKIIRNHITVNILQNIQKRHCILEYASYIYKYHFVWRIQENMSQCSSSQGKYQLWASHQERCTLAWAGCVGARNAGSACRKLLTLVRVLLLNPENISLACSYVFWVRRWQNEQRTLDLLKIKLSHQISCQHHFRSILGTFKY